MKRNIQVFLLFIFLSTPGVCFAQQTTTDSIINLLNASKEDTNKVNILYQLSEKSMDDAGMLNYAQKALLLAEKLNYSKGIADATNNIGSFYYDKGDFEEALDYYQKSLKIRNTINDKSGIAMSLNNMGTVYKKLGDLSRALDYYLGSIKIREEIGDKKGVAILLDNIGLFYKSQGENNKAFEYLEKSLKLRESIGNKNDIAISLVNIGSVYQSEGNLEKAIEYFINSSKISEQTGNKQRLAFSLYGIGMNYFNQDSYVIALEYFEKCLTIVTDLDDKITIAGTLNYIGKIYLEQKDYKKAEDFCRRSLTTARNIGVPQNISMASEMLSKIYSVQGKYKEAFEMHVLFKQMADSLNNQETRKATVKKQMQYEFDKKDAATKAAQEKKDALANAEIKRQKIIKNSTFGGVGIVGIFSFLLVRSINRRRKTAFTNQVSQVEMKALRAQMNPHFIFNSLNSIHSFIQQNKGEKASDYLIKFSRLMRLILENSNHEEVPLESDLEALGLYMELEAARMNDKFTFSIDVDEELDRENTLMPPLILQPFVENAIWHGMLHKEADGLIQITISKNGDMVKCIVQDNGVGREKAKELKSTTQKGKHESLGMKITNERIEIINRVKKSKAFVTLKDLHDDAKKSLGTLVEVQLPLEVDN